MFKFGGKNELNNVDWDSLIQEITEDDFNFDQKEDHEKTSKNMIYR